MIELKDNSARASKCTIIIPVFNRSDTVAKTLESCIAQDYSDIEVIVVDDGSTDDSVEICKRYANAKLPEGKTVRLALQDNSGACAARNHGMSIATGDFLLFLDSDDTIPPHKISTQIHAMEKVGADCSISDFMTIDENGNNISLYRNNYNPLEFIFHLKSPSNSAIIIRRSSLSNRMKWNTSLKRMQDFDFMLRYLSGVKSWAYVPEPLYNYRLHRGARISDGYVDGMPYFTVFLSMACHLWHTPPLRISRTRLLARYGLSLLQAYLKDKASALLPDRTKSLLKRIKTNGLE